MAKNSHRLFCWLNVIAPLKNYRQVHFTKELSASTFADTITIARLKIIKVFICNYACALLLAFARLFLMA